VQRELDLPGIPSEAESACREAALDLGLRLAEAWPGGMAFRDPYGWHLYRVYLSVELQAVEAGTRVLLSTSVTGAAIPTAKRELERLADLFATLMQRAAHRLAQTQTGDADVRLSRRVRSIIRLMPVLVWVPAVLLVAAGVATEIFSSFELTPFLVLAVVWVVSGSRWIVSLIRRRLACEGQESLKRFRLVAAGETALLVLVAVLLVVGSALWW
jgi:hypothetical protein